MPWWNTCHSGLWLWFQSSSDKSHNRQKGNKCYMTERALDWIDHNFSLSPVPWYLQYRRWDGIPFHLVPWDFLPPLPIVNSSTLSNGFAATIARTSMLPKTRINSLCEVFLKCVYLHLFPMVLSPSWTIGGPSNHVEKSKSLHAIKHNFSIIVNCICLLGFPISNYSLYPFQ